MRLLHCTEALLGVLKGRNQEGHLVPHALKDLIQRVAEQIHDQEQVSLELARHLVELEEARVGRKYGVQLRLQAVQQRVFVQ